MSLRITINSLPVRGPDALNILVEDYAEGRWWHLASRDFHLGENITRARVWLANLLDMNLQIYGVTHGRTEDSENL